VIYIVPYLKDNYGYIIRDISSGELAIIDGANPEAIFDTLEHFDLSTQDIVACFSTHKHWDHAGGNEILSERILNLKIYAGEADHAH
jgi:hydroxyacylglutathione hydrolase